MAVIEPFDPFLTNFPDIYYILTFKVDMCNSLNAVVTKYTFYSLRYTHFI